MLKHKIYVKRQRQSIGEPGITSLCRRAVKASLLEEKIGLPIEVSVLVTDDKGIQAINAEHRQKNTPTDVLSFPTTQYIPGKFCANLEDINPETGCLCLGDIVLSDNRARLQAEEYGHSMARELAYLVVHGTLHLLGYDHMQEEEKASMREKEERILESLGLFR